MGVIHKSVLPPRPGAAAIFCTAMLGLGVAAGSAWTAATSPAPVYCMSYGAVMGKTPDFSIPRADLVGIYRNQGCTLRLDAAGSYSRCGRSGIYSVHGDDIFLRAENGPGMWLTLGEGGALSTPGGDIYALTSGAQP